MYSDTLVTLLIGASRKQLDSVNLAGKTPLGALEDEIKYVEGELNVDLKVIKLERLALIRHILSN